MADATGSKYIRERQIDDLFQSLIVGLVSEKPDDPIAYLLDCLDKVKDTRSKDILWDMFLQQRDLTEYAINPSEVDDDQQEKQESEEEQFQRIINGDSQKLPPLPKNVVRIFISSTFSDFKAERNILPRRAYPILKKFCSEKGLDFQVVDMRWGVTDDVINDHQVSELCVSEIKNCINVSRGPNFMAMLGYRYGYRPFPSRINAEEFATILAEARSIDGEASNLLNSWFIEDRNAVPSQFTLQPITSKFRYYNNKEEEHREAAESDKQKWNVTFNALREILRKATSSALKKNKLKEKDALKYFISVTEEEIMHGMLVARKAKHRALCYYRRLTGIFNRLDDPSAARFVDVTDSKQIDEDCKRAMTALQEQKLPAAMGNHNKREYDVSWTGEALEQSDDSQHQTYLKQFADDFASDMKELITKEIESTAASSTNQHNQLFNEVLYHARFISAKCELFCGREDELQACDAYIQDNLAGKTPYILAGRSGYGKTALCAALAQRLYDQGHMTVITRFLGTSPESSNIMTVLQSVLLQIKLCFGLKVKDDEESETMGQMRRLFAAILKTVSKQKSKRSLVIILDSVDQLSELYGAHEMYWLPKSLPKNVFLFVSMLVDRYNCFENTLRRLDDVTNVLKLTPLSLDTAQDITEAFLGKKRRCLTQAQSERLIDVFSADPQPLYLKLMLDVAVTWHSYQPIESLNLASSVSAAISELFASLEYKYGRLFVSRALSYLSCGMEGLSAIEMEDVLSMDNDVLNEVYQYHDPPLDNIIRIPNIMWSRVQHDLQEYLTERIASGKTVQTFYHRQFHEAAKFRYLQDNIQTEKYHALLAKMYLQGHSFSDTIVLVKRNNKTLFNCDRGLQPQPLLPSNLRKLNSLPYHLWKASKKTLLIDQCLLNFRWILTKLNACGINDLLLDYKYETSSTTVAMFTDFLRMCFDIFRRDPNLFPYHVTVRLEPISDKYPGFKQLIAEAKAWLLESSQSKLLPLLPINFAKPDEPLRFEFLLGHSCQLTQDESAVVGILSNEVARSHNLQALDLVERDLTLSIPLEKPVPFCLTDDSRYVVYCEKFSIHVVEIKSGDVVRKFPYDETKNVNVTVRCVAVDHSGKNMVMGVKFSKQHHGGDEQWKSEWNIYAMDLERRLTRCVTPFRGKKLVTQLHFSQSGHAVVAVSNDSISLINSETLEEIAPTKTVSDLQGNVCKYIQAESRLIGAAGKRSITALSYRHSNDQSTVLFSAPLATYTKEDDDDKRTLKVFDIGFAASRNIALIGICCSDRFVTQNNVVAVWHMDVNVAIVFDIGSLEKKLPSSLHMAPDMTHLLIGWFGGQISFHQVTVEHEEEEQNAVGKTDGKVESETKKVITKESKRLKTMKPHSSHISALQPVGNHAKLMSVSQDHNVMFWDWQRLLASAATEPENSVKDDCSIHSVGDCYNFELLRDDIIATFSGNTNDCPGFWTLSGTFALETGQKARSLFNVLFENLDFPGKSFPKILQPTQDILMIMRSVRDRTLCLKLVLNDALADNVNKLSDVIVEENHGESEDTEQQRLRVSEQYREVVDDVFFHLLAHSSLKTPFPNEADGIYFVKDGLLERRSVLNYDVLAAIPIPLISEDIFDIATQGGLKKLQQYRIGMTMDARYFFLGNPSYSQKNQYAKHMVLVDLENGKSSDRIPLSKYVPYTFMNESVYYLVMASDDVTQARLFKPSDLVNVFQKPSKLQYCKPIYTERQLTSSDGLLGLETTKNNAVIVWQLDQFQQLHVLEGHLRSISCAAITIDNHLLVTASQDKAMRVWDLRNGECKASFVANSSAVKLRITVNKEFLVANLHGFSTTIFKITV